MMAIASTNIPTAVSAAKEIRMLASLKLYEYKCVRIEEAELIGCRSTALDAQAKLVLCEKNEIKQLPFPEVKLHVDPINSNHLIDEVASAKFFQVVSGTRSVWRSTGRYNIAFIKVGHLIRYRQEVLEAWLESRTHSTGETGKVPQ